MSGSARGGRRGSMASALQAGGGERAGYLYMCQRQARLSVTSYTPGGGRHHHAGRCSLPDVMDSVSMSQATRTTSLASSLGDVTAGRGGGRRVSHDLLQAPRRPSAMSLGAANGRTSLLPLLGLSDHSSTSDVGPLDEREEEAGDGRPPAGGSSQTPLADVAL